MRHYIGLNPLITETLTRMAPRPWNPHVERLEAAGFINPWGIYEDLIQLVERDRLGRSVTRFVDICIEVFTRAAEMRDRRLALTTPKFDMPPMLEPRVNCLPNWRSSYDSPNKGRGAQRRRDKPWHGR